MPSHFSTDTKLSRSFRALRVVHKRAGESEDEYFGRFASLHTTFVSYLPAESLKTLFINGLFGRIIEGVRSLLALQLNADLGLLLEESRRKGNQVPALVLFLGVSNPGIATPAERRKDPLSSVVFVYEADDADGEQLMHAGVSILTEELRSGTESLLSMIDSNKKNPHSSIEELLKMKEVRPGGVYVIVTIPFEQKFNA